MGRLVEIVQGGVVDNVYITLFVIQPMDLVNMGVHRDFLEFFATKTVQRIIQPIAMMVYVTTSTTHAIAKMDRKEILTAMMDWIKAIKITKQQ